MTIDINGPLTVKFFDSLSSTLNCGKDKTLYFYPSDDGKYILNTVDTGGERQQPPATDDFEAYLRSIGESKKK